MSDTTNPPAQPAPVVTSSMRDLMVWGAIAVSVLTAGAFSTALILAFLKGDQTNLNLLIGAVIANFSTVTTYWLGSSSDSRAATRALTAHALRQPPPS